MQRLGYQDQMLDKSVDKHDRKTSEEEKYADDTHNGKDTQM